VGSVFKHHKNSVVDLFPCVFVIRGDDFFFFCGTGA
jgi:hypothetical protein